jgi:hypothetical protein
MVIFQFYSGFYLKKIGVPGLFEIEFLEQPLTQETPTSPMPGKDAGENYKDETIKRSEREDLEFQPGKEGPVELGEYLTHFMLPKGEFHPSWWIGGDPMGLPMTWITYGVTEDGSSPYHKVRYGEARIKAGGEVLKHLTERPTEVLWTISLRGTEFGPEYVLFEPQPECWGLGGSGCIFDLMEVFQSAGISADALCQFQEWGARGMLFQIRATGKSPAYVVYLYSEGTGGRSATIKLYWRGPGHTSTHAEMCEWLDKTRGYERESDN